MGDNLKAAIVQLAISYDDFDQNVVKNEDWKETFIAKFIQNSRLSFDYLDQIADKNNGKIRINELNYTQYSFTDIKVDFSSYVKDTVDSKMEEENGVFPFEFSYSEDDLNYAHFVCVDLSKLPELADLVRKNSGSDFKVTYVLNGGETDTIEKVVPTDITLAD